MTRPPVVAQQRPNSPLWVHAWRRLSPWPSDLGGCENPSRTHSDQCRNAHDIRCEDPSGIWVPTTNPIKNTTATLTMVNMSGTEYRAHSNSRRVIHVAMGPPQSVFHQEEISTLSKKFGILILASQRYPKSGT